MDRRLSASRQAGWLAGGLLCLLVLTGGGRRLLAGAAGVSTGASAGPSAGMLAVVPAPAESDAERRRQELLQVEDEWLHAKDGATLERILADDFVHLVPQGATLGKAEHIAWFVKHPQPLDRLQRFEQMRVRLYGQVGIVNGVVVTTQAGKETRSLFTDVFDYRDGRWQAVNAQENALGPATGCAGG